VIGSKPELNLLNPNLGVQFEVQKTAELNLFCGFRFGSKVPEPAPDRTADSLCPTVNSGEQSVVSNYCIPDTMRYI